MKKFTKTGVEQKHLSKFINVLKITLNDHSSLQFISIGCCAVIFSHRALYRIYIFQDNTETSMIFRKLALTFFLIFLSPLAMAYGIGNGKIGLFMVHSGDKLFFTMESISGQPTCASSGSGKFSVSLLTKDGQAMYLMLLSAKEQERSLTVVGTNDCTITATREDVYRIHYP